MAEVSAPGPTADLTPPQAIHVVGIGGAGMSAIASVLAAMGHRVSGSDLRSSKALDRLADQGIRVAVGHRAEQLEDAAVVAVSTAIAPDNPEVVAARASGRPVLRRSEVLAAITALRRTISVAGTHGKTTTSSMLAVILAEAGMDPSFIIGGDVNQIGSGAVWSEGEWFVVEADESDGTFVELKTEVAVVTNVEADHHAHYGGFDALRDAFDRFVDGAGLRAIVGVDDTEGRALAERHEVATVGEHADAGYRIHDLRRERRGTTFRLLGRGIDLGEIHLPVPGAHNARNAAVAAATALEVGAPFEAATAALARFGGVARRFEFRGEAAGVAFVDDYAHLPTEVAAALAAGRDTAPDRLVAVFQPHRYSRVAALGSEFGASFADADLLAVTDVYSAGEVPVPGVSGKTVVDAIRDADPTRAVDYLPRREDLVAYLVSRLRPGDLCLTLGAGDLTTLPDEIQAALLARPKP
ncbi:MAG TPA: UDP-N-acetylmuramate--L-alanine ligase [Acidimicrobiales bacterium]